MYNTLLIPLNLLLAASIYITSKSSISPAYRENLSCHRTIFTTMAKESNAPVKKSKQKNAILPIEHDITSQLYELLVDLKSYYNMTELIPGYTIQAYIGGNRQVAFQIKDQLCACYPYFNVEVQYKQPHFTVHIGRFLDRLEAYQLYLSIQKILPQAIIRPMQFLNKAGIFDPPANLCIDNLSDEKNLSNFAPKLENAKT